MLNFHLFFDSSHNIEMFLENFFFFSEKNQILMYLQTGIFKTGVTQMFSFAKKGKATVIRYLVTVLRDRERRSFLHLLRSFFF